MIFQDGRPLIYDSGLPGGARAPEGPDRLGRLRRRAGRGRCRGRHLGIGLACYVEGTGVGPYEGAHVHVETNGRVMVATGLTSQGQGHETVFAQIVADELGVDVANVYVTTGTPGGSPTPSARTPAGPR